MNAMIRYHLWVVLLLLGSWTTCVDATRRYLVATDGVGSLFLQDDQDEDYYNFQRTRGFVECRSVRGCVVGSHAIVRVMVDRDTNQLGQEPMQIDVQPGGDFTLSIMCNGENAFVNECYPTACLSRDFDTNCDTQIVYDRPRGTGCTVHGTNVRKLGVYALCDPRPGPD